MHNSFVILKFKGNLKIKCMEILVHSLCFKKKFKKAQKIWINQLLNFPWMSCFTWFHQLNIFDERL